MKAVKFEFSDLVDDYVVWKPDYNLAEIIENDIRNHSYYQLDLDVQRSENREGNLIAVFVLQGGVTYYLGGGVKVIKESRVHTKITSIERVEIVHRSSKNYKLNEQYSNETMQIYERVRYPMFHSKPERKHYQRYLDKANIENTVVEKIAQGQRIITKLSTKHIMIYHFYFDALDEIKEAIKKEGHYIFPGPFPPWKSDEGETIAQSATVMIWCSGQYYLVTPEYSTDKNDAFIIYITALQPVVIEPTATKGYHLVLSCDDYHRGKFEFAKRWSFLK